jgi:hypothetical protein
MRVPPRPAPRRAFMHGFKLGGDLLERTIGRSRLGWNHLGECRGSGTRVIAADIRLAFYREKRRIKSKPTSSSRSWHVACTRYGAVCMPRRPPSS